MPYQNAESLMIPRPISAQAHAFPWLKAMLMSIALFGLLAFFQSVASYNELQQQGSNRSFLDVFLRGAIFYPPWIAFSVGLFAFADRIRDRLTRPVPVLILFAICTVLFYVPYMMFEVGVALVFEGRPLSNLPDAMRKWPPFGYFVDYLIFCGCFFSIHGLALVRGQWQRERQNRLLEAQTLNLTLELEQQRLAAIQAQLEPHFLFNALSAISALVRTDDKRTALSAISRLSDLLRYALTVSRRDWVTLSDELSFVGHYLELQKLRYGDRLSIRIEADPVVTADHECPPLLLQPLVENALRHGVETHQSRAEVTIRVLREAENLRITIDNPLPASATANPGLGLGLASTRDRLRLRYGEAVSLATSTNDGRFVVTLVLPEHNGG